MVSFDMDHICPFLYLFFQLLSHSKIECSVFDYIHLTIFCKVIFFIAFVTNHNIILVFWLSIRVIVLRRLRYLLWLIVLRAFMISRMVVLRTEVTVEWRFVELLILAERRRWYAVELLANQSNSLLKFFFIIIL